MNDMTATRYCPADLLEKLDHDIHPWLLSEREGGNKTTLSYVKVDILTDTLNKLFGPLGWGVEAEIQKMDDFEYDKPGYQGAPATPMYVFQVISQVKLTIKAQTDGGSPTVFVQSGIGYGEVKINGHRKDAVGMAVKGAESDGLKRCCNFLGRALGMFLVGGKQDPVVYAHNGNRNKAVVNRALRDRDDYEDRQQRRSRDDAPRGEREVRDRQDEQGRGRDRQDEQGRGRDRDDRDDRGARQDAPRGGDRDDRDDRSRRQESRPRGDDRAGARGEARDAAPRQDDRPQASDRGEPARQEAGRERQENAGRGRSQDDRADEGRGQPQRQERAEGRAQESRDDGRRADERGAARGEEGQPARSGDTAGDNGQGTDKARGGDAEPAPRRRSTARAAADGDKGGEPKPEVKTARKANTNYDLRKVPVTRENQQDFGATFIKQMENLRQPEDREQTVKSYAQRINELDPDIRALVVERLRERDVDVSLLD